MYVFDPLVQNAVGLLYSSEVADRIYVKGSESQWPAEPCNSFVGLQLQYHDSGLQRYNPS